MRDYQSGKWGFSLIWGLRASVFPRALVLALPNAAITLVLSTQIDPVDEASALAKEAWGLLANFTSVLFFVLYFRSNIAYRRWWEGGTLLQKTRGEWFNSYSSLIAFSSTDVAKEREVESYHHLLARLMSLLLCSALQQVSPDHERPFEVLDTYGIDPESIEFLNESTDKVEVLLQWVQRSTIRYSQNGVLSAPPPILSRAFQEISRGIVNLQNARKIADFPFPFPYAQTSIVMLIIHWSLCPIITSMLLKGPLAAAASFFIIFFLWCINYIAFELEMPFGEKDNDLPLDQFQSDWNKSLVTLLAKRAREPPDFNFEPHYHRRLDVVMSDGARATKRRMTFAGKMQELRELEESKAGLKNCGPSRLSERFGQLFVVGPPTPPKPDETDHQHLENRGPTRRRSIPSAYSENAICQDRRNSNSSGVPPDYGPSGQQATTSDVGPSTIGADGKLVAYGRDRRPSDSFSESDLVSDDLQDPSEGSLTPVPSPRSSQGASPGMRPSDHQKKRGQASRSPTRLAPTSTNVQANPLLKYIVCGSCSAAAATNCGTARSVTSCTR